jgi:hypothetical protein
VESSYTLLSCQYQGNSSLEVIDVKLISAVVAMVPYEPTMNISGENFFVVEKPGLDIAQVGGDDEVVLDE